MSRKALPSITQTNLQNAIANLEDQEETLKSLLRIRSLPTRVVEEIAKAISLNAVAKSHLLMADNLSTDRLIADGQDETRARSTERRS